MSNSFRERIRTSIENKNLQKALDANAQIRVEGSVAAFASLPDHQERRQRAHMVRENVIAKLDEVAAQFLAKVEKNGYIVHRAKDADEAVKIALKIIENQTPRTQKNTTGEQIKEKSWPSSRLGGSNKLIAKSKSMVTEEIELNETLEAAGHRVVETDLGEYIVQLRNEKPSHITTPAVHLRRQDVAQLFQDELGIPYTEDIPSLTEAARQALRKVFLSADVGVSGVNFGIAESGSLCIVTNEGNGRMVTTLPSTHIAVMGMERLLPTMDNLALMLSLLPRSSTTQKITVYTQFIQRPLDGQERHLIFLDNGRSNLRNSPINDGLMCIRCGACLNACPIFQEIGGHAYNSIYPGPIGSVISAGLFGPEHAPLAQACTVCGACKEACPVDIDLPKMLLRVRAGQASRSKEKGVGIHLMVKLGLNAYRRIALLPRLFGVAQKLIGRFSNSTKSASTGFLPLPMWTGWGYSKDFPSPAMKSFRERFRPHATDLIRKDLPKINVGGKSQVIPNDTLTLIPQRTTDFLASRFSMELEQLSGEMISVSAKDLPKELVAYLRQRGVTRVHTDVASSAYLQNQDIAHQREADPNIVAGITAAVAAVAETGSLLITGQNRDQLCASLLPEIHIAILQATDIHKNLEEVLALPEIKTAPAASLISGPSRTADIEMTLTIGVHGPRELIVFLVDG